MIVAWRSGSQQGISKMGTMALGGIFLNTAPPPSVGSVLDLIFEVHTGAHVRARAMVRTSRPGQGMGVKFVHMRSEDRSRLNQFLKSHIAAGNIEEDLRTEDGQVTRPREMVQEAAPVVCSVSSSWEMIFVPREKRVSPIDVGSPFLREHVKEMQEGSGRQLPQARNAAREPQPPLGEELIFEEELKHLAISEKGTYYGLLGIPGDCDKAGIKQSFYVLARKFHPDRHMHSPQCAGPFAAVDERDHRSLQRAQPRRKAGEL